MATKDNHNQQINSHDDTVPPLMVNAQYLKDITFENPNPVKFLQNNAESPEINVSIDIKLESMGDKTYEVTLQVSASAERKTEKLFIVEIEYAGIFTLGNLPEEAIHPVLMIECPRMLFPYVRQIIANLTREGGFPALSLNPIDFVEMYHQQMAQHQQPPKSSIIQP